MADEKDKTLKHVEVQRVTSITEVPADAQKTTVISVALTDAIAKDQPDYKAWPMIRLYGIMALVTLNCCMNGFDGSLMGSINSMDPYHNHFNVGMQGGGTGIVFAIYSVGSILGSLAAAWIADQFGRRWGMFIGSLLIIIGAVLEASASALGQFMGGRLIIGFGVSVGVTGSIVYLVEMSYPSWRGIFGGLYNVCGWYIGAIIASWVTYGTGQLSTNWSWRIPTICQTLPSLVVVCFVWLLPESPRWHVRHNKLDQARATLIKYHGFGNPNSAIVELEIAEILDTVNHEIESSDKRWWDYRPLFQTRANRYRVWLLLLISVFSQFIGGSVISYYMSVILEDVGITSSHEQLLLYALNNVFSFMGGLAGSAFVDKIGRRKMLIIGTLLTGLCYVPINVIASQANGHVGTGAGYTFIAFIFLYGITFSFGWTPLQALYPAEILTNEMRAKGMAFQSFLGGLASFINQYATPVALKNIGWKTYTIFLILHFVELVLIYLTVPETKGRSLEEVEDIFASNQPVKKSLEKQEVVVKKGEGVTKMLDGDMQ